MSTDAAAADTFAFPESLGTTEVDELLVSAPELGAVLRAAYPSRSQVEAVEDDGAPMWSLFLPAAGIRVQASCLTELRSVALAATREFVANNDVTHPLAWLVKTSRDQDLADWLGLSQADHDDA